MIIGGFYKEDLEFYLVKKPIVNLFSKKEVLKSLKMIIKTIIIHFKFSLLSFKEKSLYNLAFIKDGKVRGGSIGTLLR